jgi:phosphate/sulfate permease
MTWLSAVSVSVVSVCRLFVNNFGNCINRNLLDTVFCYWISTVKVAAYRAIILFYCNISAA